MAEEEKNVIEITDHQHIHDMGIWMGANRVFERLRRFYGINLDGSER